MLCDYASSEGSKSPVKEKVDDSPDVKSATNEDFDHKLRHSNGSQSSSTSLSPSPHHKRDIKSSKKDYCSRKYRRRDRSSSDRRYSNKISNRKRRSSRSPADKHKRKYHRSRSRSGSHSRRFHRRQRHKDRSHSSHRRNRSKKHRSYSSSSSDDSRGVTFHGSRKRLTQAYLDKPDQHTDMVTESATVISDGPMTKVAQEAALKAAKLVAESINKQALAHAEAIAQKLNSLAPQSANETTTTPMAGTGSSKLDPQEILARIQQHQQTQAKEQAAAAEALASLPKFYNPSAVNALKLAEQQQKRKLLWSKKSEDDNKKAMWSSTSLIAGKGNQQAAAKFCKLMGLGETALPEVDNDDGLLAAASTGEAAQSALFRRLEQEYEASRTHTHTQRGVGLGYSSHGHIDYSAYAAMRVASGGTAEALQQDEEAGAQN